jgi:hypothetical protein
MSPANLEAFTEEQQKELFKLPEVNGTDNAARKVFVRPGALGTDAEVVLYANINRIVGMPVWVEEKTQDGMLEDLVNDILGD